MAVRWNLPSATTPYVAPTQVNISPLTQLPEYFNKLQQQELANQRQAEAMEMRKQQIAQTQSHRNRMMSLQEQKLKAGPAPTAAQRNFQFGQQNPAFNDWRRANSKAGAPNVNVNMPNQAKKFDEKIGSGFGDMALEGMKGSRKARQEIQSLNLMKSALQDPNVHQGTGGQTAQMIKKAAQSLFGMKVDGVASGELIQRMSKRLALKDKDQLPGPLSDSDVRLLLTLPASLSGTPEGNRLTIEMGLLQREYVVARNTAMAKYFRANRGNIDPFTADEILGQVDKEFTPRFQQFLQQATQGGQALPPTSPTAGIPQLKSKAEYDAAPSGTVFIAPDGTSRVKP